jgi:hypothetical protein
MSPRAPFGRLPRWCGAGYAEQSRRPARSERTQRPHCTALRESDGGPRVRARLSFGLVATFIGFLAVLHFLEPEFNSGHLISEYQLGRHGWIATDG